MGSPVDLEEFRRPLIDRWFIVVAIAGVDHRCGRPGAVDDGSHRLPGQTRVEHDDHRTYPESSEERSDEVDAVGKDDEHPVAGDHTLLDEPSRIARGEPIDLCVDEDPVIYSQSGSISGTLLETSSEEEVVGIELFWPASHPTQVTYRGTMRIAMITGISSGIGKATALDLGQQGFHVVGAGRSRERTMPVVEEIQSNGGSAEFLELDLASLRSCRNSAETFVESKRTIDVLVNNAGVGGTRGVTADGFEITFGVNHLGHFMLTRGLEPALEQGTRIVQVTSAAHFNADGIDFERVEGKTRSLFGWKEYAVSKLANMLFVKELARRRPRLRAYGVHPGLTDTNIFPALLKPFMRGRMFTPEQGAETVIWCASSEDVAGESGLYYRRRESRPASKVAQDEALAAELWERSERWCRID